LTIAGYFTTMQGLSPPPPTRHRASSIRSALSRRRSSSCLNDPTPPPPLTIDPIPSQPSMLVIIAARFFEWLHLQPKHSFSWSTPSSPRSSTDEYVLPLSASAHKPTFGDDIHHSISKSQFSLSWRASLSVCNPVHRYSPLSSLFTATCTNIDCPTAFPYLNGPCSFFLGYFTYLSHMAQDNCRCCPAGERTQQLYPEWSAAHRTRRRRFGYHSDMEACLVNPR
jgi:hypothetical protein